MYGQVYVYEARFLLQYERGRAHRVARNMVTADGWQEILAKIDSTSQMVDQAMREHVSAITLDAVYDIEAAQQVVLKTMRVGAFPKYVL